MSWITGTDIDGQILRDITMLRKELAAFHQQWAIIHGVEKLPPMGPFPRCPHVAAYPITVGRAICYSCGAELDARY